MGQTASNLLPVLRVGSVSYLNAKPLIYGLTADPGVELLLELPAKLLAGLREERFDVALLPIIDYQRLPGLRLLQSGAIGSNGTTYTVRIFSKVPIAEIQTLGCDTHSHTSVALARVLLGEVFGIQPRFVDFAADDLSTPTNAAESRLLIGDKVVNAAPQAFPFQLDLGAAWKQFTGLPFVFAAWVARAGVELGDLPERLTAAKRAGLAHVDEIVAEFAGPHGWPAALARQYLTEYLKFDLAEPQLTAIRHFHALAAKYGLVPDPPLPLEIVDDHTHPKPLAASQPATA